MLSKLQGYHRPKSISEALALLEKNSGTILVIAGGTKLVNTENDTVQELVDITSLGLRYIREDAGTFKIGATTNLQTIVSNPQIQHCCHGILSEAVVLDKHARTLRNIATLGGELLSSTPLSVLYCALSVLQAQVRMTGSEEFALAMNIFLNKRPLTGGLLIEIIVPKTEPQTYAAIASISTNSRKSPALASCVRLCVKNGNCHHVKIGLTGTEKVPQRQFDTENVLEGKSLTNQNIEIAADTVYKEYKPITDSLASEEFRKEACGLVVKKALTQCLKYAEEAL